MIITCSVRTLVKELWFYNQFLSITHTQQLLILVLMLFDFQALFLHLRLLTWCHFPKCSPNQLFQESLPVAQWFVEPPLNLQPPAN